MRQIITAILIICAIAAITKGLQDLAQQRARETRFRHYEDSLLLKMEADKHASNRKP